MTSIAYFEEGITIFDSTQIVGATTGSIVTYGGLSVFTTTISSGITSGALVVAGGVGITGTTNGTASNWAGIMKVTNGTGSSGSGNGALVVTGGVGIGQNLNVAGDATISGSLFVAGTTTTVNSTTITIADNTFQVNSGPPGTRDAGFLIDRYQVANDAGSGDVVTDVPSYVSSSATVGSTTTDVVFQNTLSGVTDFYKYDWIKFTSGAANNEVRRITAYNGATFTATVATAFGTAPSNGDTFELYNKNYVAHWYDTITQTYIFGYISNNFDITTNIDGGFAGLLDIRAGAASLTSATIANVYVSGATSIASLNVTSQTVSNLFATSSSFTNSVVTNGTTANLVVTNNSTIANTYITNGSAGTLNISDQTVGNSNVNNETVANLVVTNNSTIANTYITNGSAGTLNITQQTVGNSNVNNETVANLVVTNNSTIANTFIVSGTAATLNVTNMTGGTVYISDATITNLQVSGAISNTNGAFTNATITNLITTNQTVTNLTVLSSTIANTLVTNGTLSNVYITDGSAGTLNISAQTVGNSNVLNQTVSNLVVTNNSTFANAYITSGTAASLVVNGTNIDPTPGDIIQEAFFLAANNQSSQASVTGLVFANATVRSFRIHLSVSITTTGGTDDKYANFELLGIQRQLAGDWLLNSKYIGDNTGIKFFINSSGQIRYTSNNTSGFIRDVFRWRAQVTAVHP